MSWHIALDTAPGDSTPGRCVGCDATFMVLVGPAPAIVFSNGRRRSLCDECLKLLDEDKYSQFVCGRILAATDADGWLASKQPAEVATAG